MIYQAPSAYLNTDNNEETIMLLKGKLAELMVQVDPKCWESVLFMANQLA